MVLFGISSLRFHSLCSHINTYLTPGKTPLDLLLYDLDLAFQSLSPHENAWSLALDWLYCKGRNLDLKMMVIRESWFLCLGFGRVIGNQLLSAVHSLELSNWARTECWKIGKLEVLRAGRWSRMGVRTERRLLLIAWLWFFEIAEYVRRLVCVILMQRPQSDFIFSCAWCKRVLEIAFIVIIFSYGVLSFV